jgi:hypothetical protein
MALDQIVWGQTTKIHPIFGLQSEILIHLQCRHGPAKYGSGLRDVRVSAEAKLSVRF